jgi:hypothetical protein
MTPDQRREYIRRVVDEAPPLTPERCAELRELFRDAVAVVQARKRDEAA